MRSSCAEVDALEAFPTFEGTQVSRAAVQQDIVAKSEVLAKEVCVLSASLTFKLCTARNLCVVMKNSHVSKMKSFENHAKDKVVELSVGLPGVRTERAWNAELQFGVLHVGQSSGLFFKRTYACAREELFPSQKTSDPEFFREGLHPLKMA